MKDKQNYFMMALIFLMVIGLIVSISMSVGYATKVSTREYEFEILRKDYEEKINQERKAREDAVKSLEDKFNSEAYLNKRRYEILDSQISESNNNNNEKQQQ